METTGMTAETGTRAAMPVAPENMSQEAIAARLERLPISRWHTKMRIVVGTATFFDAFDVLSIAYVAPVLIGEWHLAPSQIGALLSIGFAGQAVGAIGFGGLAERVGRISAIRLCIAIFAVMGLACAFAQDYAQLCAFRFVQGVGLGGEVPIAAAYISEISRSERRGRFFLLYEVIYPVGLLAVGIVASWVVPNLGWRWLFAFGAAPIVLVFTLQHICVESPRWLASKGRLEEAERVVGRLESFVSKEGTLPLPPMPPLTPVAADRPTRFSELFGRVYRTRTFVAWALWATSFLVTFGLVIWMPTIYRTVYKLPLEQSLRLSLFMTLAGLLGSVAVAFLIDLTGRRFIFTAAFLLSAVPLLVLAMIGGESLASVVVLGALAYFGANMTSLGLYLYTSEIYPTRMRALGASLGSFWLRIASILSPYIVGFVLPAYGVSGVFLMFGCFALVGGVVAAVGMTETRNRILEEIAP